MRVIISFVLLVFLFGGTEQRHVRSSFLKEHGNDIGNDLTDSQIDHIIKTTRRYSNLYEAELWFECDDIAGPEDFKSDGYTWRRVRETAKSHAGYSYHWDPQIQEGLVDPFNHSILHAAEEADTLRMALSPDVTEIGCFDKICDGFEYIACKTGHNIDVDMPLYTPNTRCEMDADCSLPGYHRCDTALGLCDLDPADKKVVSPLVCLSLSSPRVPLFQEKCGGVNDTGSAISEAERRSIVNSVNEFRAMVNNNCTLGLGIPSPASNYRKVRYSCALESKLKFECSPDMKRSTYISDEKTWRSTHHRTDLNNLRLAVFHYGVPPVKNLLIDPVTATVDNDSGKDVFMRLFMSADVTEVGCYVQVCGDLEYIACKTNHNHTVPTNAPLYTPGQRCNVDSDCTLPGYRTCDANVGLCDYKSHYVRKRETQDKCADPRNVHIERVAESCKGWKTGSGFSNLEREVYVYVVNQFRALINNNCDLGNGSVKAITNYRKVKYSCKLEKEAEFSCTDVFKNPEFNSDNFTLRVFGEVQSTSRKADFIYWSPYNQYMKLDPDTQIGRNESVHEYMNFMLSPDVTEFGCFIKVCGYNEYMACKTGHVVLAPKEQALYKPGKRCIVNADCTLPGYTLCDEASGLCDISPKSRKKRTVSPLVCQLMITPEVPALSKEKCNGIHKTGSETSQAERNAYVNSINEFRAYINNNCTTTEHYILPKPMSNYRKVKYSCALESQSMFECCSNVSVNTFKSSNQTWRGFDRIVHHDRLSLLHRAARILSNIYSRFQRYALIDERFMKLFLSVDVTEVGCYVKVCGDYEYIACKSNHDHTLPWNVSLYTPGRRCDVDADCTLSGYTTCDAYAGLCDYRNHMELKKEADTHKCDILSSVVLPRNTEQCWPFNTGSEISNMERELIVFTVNYYRKRINNNCNFGKGSLKLISNYRKVKYSCALEADVKFECEDVDSYNFNSDEYVLRTLTDGRSRPAPILFTYSPYGESLQIDSDNQTIEADNKTMTYARLMLSPEVTKIGCFVKKCYSYEYLACKTGHPIIASKNKPLYKPGNRCIVDEDCTLPGYGICDDETGLCDTS